MLNKSKLLDIRIAFEDILYDKTTNDITKDEIEQIREEINTSLNDFMKENSIE